MFNLNYQAPRPIQVPLTVNRQRAVLEHYIQPETKLEQILLMDPAWLRGAFWGKPRPGHPEGQILFHIQDVLANINAVNFSANVRQDLRLVAIIHDTFKYLEESQRPRRDWSKHHAAIAKRFAKNYLSDERLLQLIALHDDAYYAWKFWQKGRKAEAENKLAQTFKQLGPENKQLFYNFFKCDTWTGNKTQQPIAWFENTVKDIDTFQF